MEAQLRERDEDLLYLFTRFSHLGLCVVAFEACSIGEIQDMVRSSAYLMSPFRPNIQELLHDWNPANQFRIVSAGVGGEPLFKPALLESGLTDEELNKLAEFYDLYDPFQETKKERVRRENSKH